jgi:hypothetical protein
MPPTPPTEDLDRLSAADLKALVYELLQKVAELERTVAVQRDEIARLKGGPGRPNIKPNSKPSGMEQASDPKPPAGSGKERRRGSTRSKLTIDETRKVKLAAPPPGARFKGYTSFVVQDLVLHPHVVDFKCERWQTADGKVITAPLPDGFDGHFGPQLRRFVLALYHQGQTTVARILTLLRSLGIDISKREVVRLLTAGHDGFHDEARDVLRAGLAGSAWITVDDTGARHQAKNGFCTQIGNAHFTAFITGESKSRLNFLSVLRAGYDDYVVNDEALAYMRERALAGPVIAKLAGDGVRSFADQAAWTAHLEKLGIAALKVTPDPMLIATEGALWGSVKAHGLLCDTVIVSDDATSSTPSPSKIAPPRPARAPRSGSSTATSKLIAAPRAPSASANSPPNSIASSPPPPASSPSIGCWRGSTPTRPSCSKCSNARKSRSIPTARKMTSAAMLPGAKSQAAPAATAAATAATLSSPLPRPVPNSASASGTTSAHVSAPAAPTSRRFPN